MEVVVTRVGKKGVVVIPKKLRDALGLVENSLITMELKGSEIALKPFTPKRVKLGGRISRIVSEVKWEELKLEK